LKSLEDEAATWTPGIKKKETIAVFHSIARKLASSFKVNDLDASNLRLHQFLPRI